MTLIVDHLGVERLRLVVHDWGTAALAFVQRFPERIERLVIADGVPLLPGYRWHRLARLWRTRGVGELFMGAANGAAEHEVIATAGHWPGIDRPELVGRIVDFATA